MPGTDVYDRLEDAPSKSRNWGEAVQIAALACIILVFFAIAASNAVGLMVSAMHR